MRRLRNKLNRPWLTPTGVEIATIDLKPLVKNWDLATWESYLDWYDGASTESTISQKAFASICEHQEFTVFELYSQCPSEESLTDSKRLLHQLPELEREVIRMKFMEGLTEVEIAFEMRRSRSGINLIKTRALSRLKKLNPGDAVAAGPYMRGEVDSSDQKFESVWDEPSLYPIREKRNYITKRFQEEISAIRFSSVREALFDLPEIGRKILFFRYWCDFSVNQTARLLKCGQNVVEQIETASISKVKRGALSFETGTNFGGGK